MGINEKIAALRKSNNMTQAELGTKLNVTFQAVSKWESGKSYPDFETLSKMAKIFGVPISYFEEGGENVAEIAATATATADELGGTENTKVVGFCKDCGKLVHEGEESCTTPVVICKACALRRENIKKIQENEQKLQKQQAEQATKAKRQAEINRQKRRRNRGLIASAIITGALLILFTVLAIQSPQDVVMYVAIMAFTVVCGYPFFAQLFWDGIVVDIVLVGGKIVGMPGVIFSLDLDGIIFLIVVKILFALIKMLIFALTFLFMIFVAMVVATFVFIPQMHKLNRGEEL
ncbi:MAG: helix-turn-helix domain-containing protein [Clostridiales bacterium]|nr:helix-turn-helix domain-containing protein [Clostridiales bacterium]